ncbi:MAG: transposase [Polyangiales bacterium]
MATSKRHAGSDSRRRRGRNRQIVLPGQTVFASVRTLHRRYLLKPNTEIREAVLYLLGHYAEKWGIEILAFSFMSNHYHLVLRDTRGLRPKFFADFNRTLAQVVKAKYGWSGAVFKELSPPIVLRSAFAIVDKIAYTLANPVAAGAVRFPREWPGLISRLEDMGIKRYRAKRPTHFFGKKTTLPDDSSFTLVMCPWLLEHYGSREAAMTALETRLHEHVDTARSAVREKGWKFLGANRVMKLSPFKRAKSYEVFGKLTPHFATIGLSEEEAIAVKREFLAWQARYDDCRERFLRGESVVWPAGTWAMVQSFGQVAEPA